jgi:hypothetical protein
VLCFVKSEGDVIGCSRQPVNVHDDGGDSERRPQHSSCYERSERGKPPVSKGTATVENGVQVVNIKVENGY